MDENQDPINFHSPSSILHPSAQPSWRDWRNAILKAAVFIFFLLFLAVHFGDPIRLVTADLGRHLKNGELILTGEHKVFTANFYSYTQPSFPFVNHHWGCGVLFYLIYQWGGFTGLSFFYIGVLLLTFILFFRIAENFSDYSCAFFFSVLALPIMTDRLEIRPEGLSVLLIAIYLYLLFKYQRGELSFRWLLWTIPFLQIFWVNTHIFFFMGGFLIVVFLLDAWLSRRDPQMMRDLFVLCLCAAAASVVNPAFIKGALVPLTIFKEYGYRLAENQSVLFMQKRFGHDPKYLYFEGLVLLSLIGWVMTYWKKNWRAHIAATLIFLFFLLLGLKTVRSMAMFAFVFIPLSCFFWAAFMERFSKRARRVTSGILLAGGLLIVGHGMCFANSYFSPCQRLEPFIAFQEKGAHERSLFYLLRNPQIWTGLVPGINRPAEFFQQLKIQGPVFNNYDIGGYLIFHLAPKTKVFVDNRPEAYSVPFFKEIYVPMQEDDRVWHKVEEQYHFNSIFFYRYDLTPWGQDFLIHRIQDPTWAPVFVDAFTIIFLKRNEQNKAVINAFELPRSMFAISDGR